MEHVRGWVMKARVVEGDGTFALFCAHNYEVGNSVMRRLVAALHAQADAHALALLRSRDAFMSDANIAATQCRRGQAQARPVACERFGEVGRALVAWRDAHLCEQRRVQLHRWGLGTCASVVGGSGASEGDG